MILHRIRQTAISSLGLNIESNTVDLNSYILEESFPDLVFYEKLKLLLINENVCSRIKDAYLLANEYYLDLTPLNKWILKNYDT